MWSDWLVFCDWGFQSVYPLMEKDKRLMEASWWERVTWGKLGLGLMGRAILNKSLVQFSVEGWAVLPPCYLPGAKLWWFSSSHVWMWELDWEESWVPKNWCFWTVVLEKTLESPLDCKEIQPVHSKGDQSWVSFGRSDAKAETPVLWQLMWRVDSLEKTLMLGGIGGRRRRGQQRMRWLDGTIDFQMFKWVDHGKNKRVPEKHLFQLYWLCQSLWLCGSQ